MQKLGIESGSKLEVEEIQNKSILKQTGKSEDIGINCPDQISQNWQASINNLIAAIRKNESLKAENILLSQANKVLSKRKNNLLAGKETLPEEDKPNKNQNIQKHQVLNQAKYPEAMKIETKHNNLKAKKVNHHNANLERHNKKLCNENKILWSEIFLLKTQPKVNLTFIMERARINN